MDTDAAQRLMLLGRYAEALELARPEMTAPAGGDDGSAARRSMFVARLCRFVGWQAEGLSHAMRALRWARRAGDPHLHAQALHIVGIALKAAGDLDRAGRYLAAAEQRMPRTAPEDQRAGLLLDISELSIESGDFGRGAAAVSRGAALANYIQSPKLLTWSLLMKSEVEEASPADLQLTAALEICRALQCPELEWHILWKLGVRSGENGLRRLREELFSQALAILRRLSGPLTMADAVRFWQVRPRREFLAQANRIYGPRFLDRLGAFEGTSMLETECWDLYHSWVPQVLPRYARSSILR